MSSLEYRVGVDGGGSKTECILVDAAGRIVARRLGPGCNPNVIGAEQARRNVTDALGALAVEAAQSGEGAKIVGAHLYTAGNPAFWREFAAALEGFGRIVTGPDSLPVLELATEGKPGLVLHSGTGSFVAARAGDGKIHYAGGVGWRFGDPGSGYDLGRRAISRALLEYQGWAPSSRLGPTVRALVPGGEDADASAIARHFYADPAPNQRIAALAPAVLRLASEGDHTAHQLIVESTGELLELASRVVAKLFPAVPVETLRAGLSGPILTHDVVRRLLAPRSPLPLVPVTEPPIEGVRRLVMRDLGGRA